MPFFQCFAFLPKMVLKLVSKCVAVKRQTTCKLHFFADPVHNFGGLVLKENPIHAKASSPLLFQCNQ
jgi:hypothetical protein